MSLNASIFPNLGIPSLRPDLSNIYLGKTGITKRLRRDRLGVFTELIDDLAASDHWINASRRIVIGHSFGGMLALHWLLSRESSFSLDVHGLVLVSTTAGPMYRQASLRIDTPFTPSFRVGLRWFIPLWNLQIVTRAMKRLVSRGRLDAKSLDFQTEQIKSDFDLDLAGWRNTDWRAMRAFRFAMGGFDVRKQLSQLDIPTRVVHGSNDTLLDPENARYLVNHLPNAELVCVEGAGHALPVTHPDAIVDAVRSLLDN